MSTSRPTVPSIIVFWLPLAVTWFMMGVEGPYLTAIVARMPDTAHSLAAFGVATSLAWLIESPIIMLLSAATALVRDRASYFALRRFTNTMNIAVTAGMVVLALPPVFRFVGERLIGLPPEIARVAHDAFAILIFWPAAIGYRRFYQGILVRHRLTRRVAYGTSMRLATMSVTAAVLALTTPLRGSTVAAIALLAGVVGEAAATRWMARHVVRSIVKSEEVAEGTLLHFGQIARFYFPLGLTSFLSMALGPLLTFGLGRGRAPVESLAVWPVITTFVFLFRSGGVAYQEVAIALTGTDREHAAEVRRAAMWLGALASLALAFFALTPLEAVWFERVAGLTPHLAAFVAVPIAILTVLPLLDYVLSIQRARWIISHRTSVITFATTTEVVCVAATLIIAIGLFGAAGAVGAATAMIVGRLAALTFLLIRARTAVAHAARSVLAA